MATMAISTKARSVGALLLLLAVLVGTSAPGVHATGSQTLIQNFCRINATVGLSSPNGTMNVTVGANGTTSLLPVLLNLVSSDVGIVLSFVGGPSNITVPVETLANELLAALSSILGELGGIIGGLLGNIPGLFDVSTVTITCSDTSCGTSGNRVTVVEKLFNISATVCV